MPSPWRGGCTSGHPHNQYHTVKMTGWHLHDEVTKHSLFLVDSYFRPSLQGLKKQATLWDRPTRQGASANSQHRARAVSPTTPRNRILPATTGTGGQCPSRLSPEVTTAQPARWLQPAGDPEVEDLAKLHPASWSTETLRQSLSMLF